MTLAVVLLFLTTVALIPGWVVSHDAAAYSASLAVVFAFLSAWALRVRAFHPVSGWIAFAGAVTLGAWAVLDWWSFRLPLSYAEHLTLEVFLAVLPALAIVLLVRGLERARVALAGGEAVLPLPMTWGAPLMLFAGALVRWGEIRMLSDQPGTTETLRHVLRFDAAFVLFGFGAFLLAGSLAYAFFASTERGRSRSARRVAVVAVIAVTLFSFVGYDLAVVAAVGTSPPSDLKVGMHTSNVADVDPSLVDYVHVEVPWSKVETDEGALDWTRYDAEIRAAEAKGLGVYLLAGTYPPDWLERRFPDAIMVDQVGKPFTWIDEAPSVSRARIWDLSFAHPDVVAMKHAFLGKVVDRYASSPAVITVSIQNEPAWPVDWNLLRYASYDPFTVAAFRAALITQYGAISELNANHSSSYADFRDVEAPTHPFDSLWPDWMRFREDLLVRFVENQVAEAKAFTDKPITVKIMAHYATRFAEPQAGLSDRVVRAFANASDVVSIDIYPVSIGDLRRELEYYAHVADGKPLMIGEFNFLLGSNIPTGGARLLAAFDVIAQYATHVTVFTADGHFLYGMNNVPQAPSLVALQLVKTSPLDPEYSRLLGALVVEDFLAIGNVYAIYILGTEAAGWPAVPAPLLLLVMIPVPSPTARFERYVTAGRIGLVVVAAIFIVAAVVG